MNIKNRLYTPTAQVIAEERHRIMVEFFDQLSAEWNWAL